MRFAKEELKGYPVSKVCKVLGVSKSSYYKQGKRTEKEEKEEEREKGSRSVNTGLATYSRETG